MPHKETPVATSEEILREVLDVVTQLKNGYFSAHMQETHAGVGGEIAKVLNEHLEFLQAFRNEHLRLTEQVGITGRLGGQMEPPHGTGAWRQMAEATNQMLIGLTVTFRENARALQGALSGKRDARYTSAGIQGEFRVFREMLDALAGRARNRSSAR